MSQATITHRASGEATIAERLSVTGASFSVQEWRGSGPATLHVHRSDDEAWHVLEGTLKFRFVDGSVDVPAGETVFVPAGVAHTYEAIDARYIVILTPRLAALIKELQNTPDRGRHPAIYAAHDSQLLE
jgi:mannose-6-phosphate isomerase-like protein (cupin superfamily)